MLNLFRILGLVHEKGKWLIVVWFFNLNFSFEFKFLYTVPMENITPNFLTSLEVLWMWWFSVQVKFVAWTVFFWLKPGNAAELFERASQSIKGRHYTEALNDLNSAIEADPNLSEAYLSRASVLRQLCRCDSFFASWTFHVKWWSSVCKFDKWYKFCFIRIGDTEK
jgi:hypothetical protein